MTVARTLPAALPARFARARRMQARTPGAALELVIAERFAVRLRGLSGLGEASLVPLLFPRCTSLHTLGMRTPIDVIWLGVDPDGARVVAAEEAVPPRRFVRAPGAPGLGAARQFAALELRPGDARALGLLAGVPLALRGAAGERGSTTP